MTGFVLLCLQLGTKITCTDSESTISISSLVKCIFDLEMPILELVTDFEPICFEIKCSFSGME